MSIPFLRQHVVLNRFESTPAYSKPQTEPSREAQGETKIEDSVLWRYKESVVVRDEFRELLEQYSHIPAEEINDHVVRVVSLTLTTKRTQPWKLTCLSAKSRLASSTIPMLGPVSFSGTQPCQSTRRRIFSVACFVETVASEHKGALPGYRHLSWPGRSQADL